MSKIDGGDSADNGVSSPPPPIVDRASSWAEPSPDGSDVAIAPTNGIDGSDGVNMREMIDERAGKHFDQRVNTRNIDGSFEQTCPEAAATQVLQDFGVETTFDDVIDHAVDEGICGPDGSVTDVDAVRRLVEDHGVPANAFPEGCDIHGIAGDVRNGRGVIAAVDSNTMWQQSSTQHHADHVVNVIGVDFDETDKPATFHVNDTGLPGEEGRNLQVPAEIFRNAFEGDRGGAAVITDYPRPETNDDR